ncbi:hypothetical protein KGD82_16620 [Nocardiopsis eucommiae]|uniref:Uncharacterized protein n=1 Tax=Nocardiopsis eucommiae TaxID=2831970 RepID=A0A975L5W6_9ACTN|nr:hypothetical protein KGD82_16620 [Nocardiopsis eucommiae]
MSTTAMNRFTLLCSYLVIPMALFGAVGSAAAGEWGNAGWAATTAAGFFLAALHIPRPAPKGSAAAGGSSTDA